MVTRFPFLLAGLLTAWSGAALAAGYASQEEIVEDCAKPVAAAVDAPVLDHLWAGTNTLASMPIVDCVAVLFGDTRDRTMTFQPADDRSYYITRILKAGYNRPRYRFSQTPFSFVDKPQREPGWQVIRWEFDSPRLVIAPGEPLRFRRVQPSPTGVLQEQTVFMARAFPIERDGRVVDTLTVMVDDWGRWRAPSALAERKWHVYSARANAVVLRSLLMDKESSQGQFGTGSTALQGLVYLKDGKVELIIDSEELSGLREFLDSFDVWSAG